MADFREWRGLQKRGKRLRSVDETPVRTTWHGANDLKNQRRHSRRPLKPALRETAFMVVLAVIAGLSFAAFDSGLLHKSGQANFDTSSQTPAHERSPVAFGQCHIGGGTNCVVDGDTLWMDGQKIRIADIDTPETHPPRCEQEAELGERATQRLRALLNAGPIELETIDRDTDRYGRALRIVKRNGQSLGTILVSEGLARPWEGHRRPWCP